MSQPNEWPAPDYWCTICDRGAEGCTHNPSDIPTPPTTESETS